MYGQLLFKILTYILLTIVRTRLWFTIILAELTEVTIKDWSESFKDLKVCVVVALGHVDRYLYAGQNLL